MNGATAAPTEEEREKVRKQLQSSELLQMRN